MRTFLGVIMVLIVSGDDETVSSILNGRVLLPCSCPEREVNKPFYWQMESPRMMLVFKYSNGTSTFNDRYKGRAKIFLPEHGNNCSLLLTNVTADDWGKYRCSFYSQERYGKIFVNLNVSASSRPTCTVKAEGVSTTTINDCKTEIPVKDERTGDNMSLRYRCLKIIPIVLVLGFFLVLWRRWKFSESMPTIRRRETGNCYCKTRKTNSNVTI